ncbi:MAG: hypothetical protein KAR55_05140, partial [Thermoplasmatales archaeon]|nr:hypothetical protein [Thermoplasmatales archaeon]
MKIKLPIRSKKYNLNRSYGKDRNIMLLLVISIVASTIIFLLAILSFAGVTIVDPAVISGMDFATFGILSIIGPIGFYSH